MEVLHHLPQATRLARVEQRVNIDILSLVHPQLSAAIKRLRTVDNANASPHNINMDLHYIQTAESLYEGLAPVVPISLKPELIDTLPGVQVNHISLPLNTDVTFPDSWPSVDSVDVCETRQRHLDDSTGGQSFSIVPRPGKSPPMGSSTTN